MRIFLTVHRSTVYVMGKKVISRKIFKKITASITSSLPPARITNNIKYLFLYLGLLFTRILKINENKTINIINCFKVIIRTLNNSE